MATRYTEVISVGLLSMFGFAVFVSLMRGYNVTIAPMLVMFGSVVLTIVLDRFVVFGWGPFPELDIEGAALATVSRGRWRRRSASGHVPRRPRRPGPPQRRGPRPLVPPPPHADLRAAFGPTNPVYGRPDGSERASGRLPPDADAVRHTSRPYRTTGVDRGEPPDASNCRTPRASPNYPFACRFPTGVPGERLALGDGSDDPVTVRITDLRLDSVYRALPRRRAEVIDGT